MGPWRRNQQEAAEDIACCKGSGSWVLLKGRGAFRVFVLFLLDGFAQLAGKNVSADQRQLQLRSHLPNLYVIFFI